MSVSLLKVAPRASCFLGASECPPWLRGCSPQARALPVCPAREILGRDTASCEGQGGMSPVTFVIVL